MDNEEYITVCDNKIGDMSEISDLFSASSGTADNVRDVLDQFLNNLVTLSNSITTFDSLLSEVKKIIMYPYNFRQQKMFDEIKYNSKHTSITMDAALNAHVTKLCEENGYLFGEASKILMVYYSMSDGFAKKMEDISSAFTNLADSMTTRMDCIKTAHTLFADTVKHTGFVKIIPLPKPEII